MSNQFSGKVRSINDVVYTNEKTGKNYMLVNVDVTHNGQTKTVGAKYTITDGEGNSKESLTIGQEIIVYRSQTPSTVNPGKMKNWFEIGRNAIATDDEINDFLGEVEELVEDVANAKSVAKVTA